MNEVYQSSNDAIQMKTHTAASISDDDYDEWANVSTDSGNTDNSQNNDKTKESIALDSETKEEEDDDDEEEESFEDCSMIHRCESTPVFSSYSTIDNFQPSDEEFSYVLDCDSSVDAQSLMSSNHDTILLSQKSTSTTANTMRKVPSFKDIVAANAQKLEEEDRIAKLKQKELEQKRREDAVQRRKQMRPRLIVSPITRCAHSTGDLRSLIIHEEEEGHSGGGGGGASAVIHEENEILGESDAIEYYNRKSHGSKGRVNGKKIRPDEAKRKEMIIHKKNAQRKAQGVQAKH